MTDDKHETRNTAIAAAIILLIAGGTIYFMPNIVLGLGTISPLLGAGAGVVIVMFFFVLFWVRSRYKR